MFKIRDECSCIDIGQEETDKDILTRIQNINVDPDDQQTQTIFTSLITGSDKTNKVDLNSTDLKLETSGDLIVNADITGTDQTNKVDLNSTDLKLETSGDLRLNEEIIGFRNTYIDTTSNPITSGGLPALVVPVEKLRIGTIIVHRQVWGEDNIQSSFPRYTLTLKQAGGSQIVYQKDFNITDTVNITKELVTTITILPDLKLQVANSSCDRFGADLISTNPILLDRDLLIGLELTSQTGWTLYPMIATCDVDLKV
jgi:hypothetical protein